MKRKLIGLAIGAIAATMTIPVVTSCSDDDFTPSIFDTVDHPLDRSLYTFPLDTFVKKNFLEPYNLKFIYRMEDIGSDMQKNLVPASYEKSIELAVLAKYLWYDVYDKHGGRRFLMETSPRIIHVIGSKSYNPTQGTETLGVAEGGLKITLYNANNLDYKNIDHMNEYFFKTMHHEFGHILDQTHLRPTTFNTISSGHYNSSSWQETPDSVSAGRGFVTSYASSAPGEDWVEVLANYITLNDIRWEALLNSASYEWEEVDYSRDIYDKKLTKGASRDTIGYINYKPNGEQKVYRRVCMRNPDNDNCILDEDGNVQWTHDSGINGRETILQKLDMVRTWLQTNFNVNVDSIRTEVQHRSYVTDSEGNYVLDAQRGLPINKLTQVDADDPEGRILMDVLIDGVNQYKALQPNNNQ